MDALRLFCGFLPTTWIASWFLTTLLPDDNLAKFWIPTILPFSVDLCTIIWTVYLIVNMNEKKCCVRNCNKTRADDIILHVFPNPEKELDRFNKWIYAIGGNVLVIKPETVFKHGRVCHNHFDAKYYTSSRRLSKNAVPSLNIQGISSLQLPHQPISDASMSTSTQPSTSKGISSLQLSHQPISDASMSTSTQPSTSKDIRSYSRLPLRNLTNLTREANSLDQIPETTIQFSLPSLLEPTPSTSADPMLSSLKEVRNRVINFDHESIILKNKIRRLQCQKDSAVTRLKKALKLSENKTFQKALGKFSSPASLFTKLQFREAGKHRLGCRFTKDEKILSLALYKQGPRAYRWLKKFFVLPSPLTLSRMISTASLRPGININLFRQLQKRVEKMKDADKICILLFDEIALSPHFDFNRRKDCITGFVTDGENTEDRIADHALVFMVRGVYRNFKQPLAYTFCSSTTPAVQLAAQIKSLIRNLRAIGLNVLATVCDQGATNVSAINSLINSTKEKYIRNNIIMRNKIFEIDGEEVIPLYDPPHLIKGIRNNLITKKLQFVINGQMKTANWDHVLQLYKENPAFQGIRLMPKLTERHVIPSKIAKMKVKCATQVFSRTVAAYMGYLSNKGILPKECEETAQLLLFFDELFDSINGSYDNFKKRSGKPLLGPVTPSSGHKAVWTEAKRILKTMKYISGRKSSIVPSITNWLHTIENMEYMVDVLFNKYNLTSIWMRHFNQDPLENFFGCIRSHGYRNTSPTCAGFEAAFASLLINNLSGTHSPGANCESDKCFNFKSLKELFFKKPETSSYTSEVDFDDVNSDNIFKNLEIKMRNIKIRAQLEYVTGYILRKLLIKCRKCKESLYNKENTLTNINFREYFKNKYCLTYPSHALIECFSKLQDVVTYIIKKDCKKKNIRQYMKTIFSIVIDYSFIECTVHKQEIISKIEELSINIFIYNWCKDTNKILNGLRTDFDEGDNIQILAYNYYKKRLK